MDYKLKDIEKEPVNCELGIGEAVTICSQWTHYHHIFYCGMPSKDAFAMHDRDYKVPFNYPVTTKKIENLGSCVILEDIVVCPENIKFTMRAKHGNK